jgi:tetratricopeptide (TPR) repeat protein
MEMHDMTMTAIQESTTLEERRRLQARARRLAKRAETLANAGRVDEAIVCQSEVTTLRPNDAIAFFRLGLLYREARRLNPAVLALRRALCLDPEQRDPREALIETLLEAGVYDEAITESKALVRVAPRSLYARDVLSIAYLQLGQVEKSLQVTNEMIRLDPCNPGHHFKRAMLFQHQGNIKSAVDEYTRTLEMAIPETEIYLDAIDAMATLDDYQLRQIILLAAEDRLFQMKLKRDVAEATQERGFFLSQEGILRLHQVAQSHLSEFLSEFVPQSSPGGIRFYN